MKRYQVYLNPNSVAILDELGESIDVSRSKLIQSVIDGIAYNAAKIFSAMKIQPKKTSILDSLAGSIKVKGNGKTNFAQNIDEIYLSD
ncbi:hypothetical protein HYT17_02505 [Candidatus Microgenomates bacterium]|nr:hypothetical protein [Candidatus Microgenomates bacterium]